MKNSTFIFHLEIKLGLLFPFPIPYSLFHITAFSDIHLLVLINTKLHSKSCGYLYKSNTTSRLNSLLQRFYAETNMTWSMTQKASKL